ncbi:MAG: hypothetical protein COY42_18585 [Armatimonadetes bacterium CG_4_10_14_0_8_um_filter_66_14]|nr:MAG: hypothetical protein COY42_18585 [Armatimonadetes bacterium CG_4_10_14_0_8_um_filter_66_14]
MTLLLGALLMTTLGSPATAAGANLYETGAEHPRLLCTAAELAEVRARLGGDVERLAYAKLREKCDGYLDPKSSLYVDWPERKNHYWRDRSGATWLTKCFEELAWIGVLSGEKKYVAGAKNIVLTIIRERVTDGIAGTNYGQEYKGWLSQPLDAGHSSRSLAVFYDLLYDQLTEGERTEVRDYITGTYLRYFDDYMRTALDSPQYPGLLGHNFALIGNSSAALLTLAVGGETGNAEKERAWLDLFLDGIKQYLDIGIGPDGGALEGAGYTSACLYYLTFPAEALRRAGGENLFEHPRLRKVFDYYLYEMLPGRNYYDNTNDSFFHAHTCFFPLYARVLDRPEIAWMWAEISGRRTDPADVFGEGRNAAQPLLNYLLLWNGVAPAGRSPDETNMPLSARFSRRGLVTMRSGWGEEDCLLSFTCGGNPTYGHGQYDSGHFALYCGSSALAGDTGYGGGQSEDHNTVLFDGAGQKTKCAEGRIVAFAPAPEATYAAGRIGDLYANDALKSYVRHVCFVHDRDHPYAVVYDQFETDGKEHAYTWMLQGVNDHGFMMSGDGIDLNVAGEFPEVADAKTGWKLRVVLFATAKLAFSTDVKEIRWNPTATAVPHPRLKADVRTAQPPDILAVLLPHRGDATLPRVTQEGVRSVRVEWPDRTETIRFPSAATDAGQPSPDVFTRSR